LKLCFVPPAVTRGGLVHWADIHANTIANLHTFAALHKKKREAVHGVRPVWCFGTTL